MDDVEKHTSDTKTFTPIGFPWRDRLRNFLDEPKSSLPSAIFNLVICTLILASSTAVVCGSHPIYHAKLSSEWQVGEALVFSVFLTEFVMRLLVHTASIAELGSFLTSFLTLCDLMALVPCCICFVDRHERYENFVVFRLFRLLAYITKNFSEESRMFFKTFQMALTDNAYILITIAGFQAVLIVIFATLLHFVERGSWNGIVFMDADDQPSKFSSIPESLWFVVAVITTVGLGDTYPKTPIGKLISYPLMLSGLLVIALPSIVLGKGFADAWHHLQTKDEKDGGSVVKELKEGKMKLSDGEMRHLYEMVKALHANKTHVS